MQDIPSDNSKNENTFAKGSSRETLQHIIDAASIEFAEHGIEGARLGDIARRAGVSPQLVHHYFGPKAQLYLVVLEELAATQVSELLQINYEAMSPPAALRYYMQFVFDQYYRNAAYLALVQDQNLHAGAQITEQSRHRLLAPQLVVQIDGILKRGAAEGCFRAGLDAEKILSTAFLLSAGWLMNRSMTSIFIGTDLHNEAAVKEWIEFSSELLLAALRP